MDLLSGDDMETETTSSEDTTPASPVWSVGFDMYSPPNSSSGTSVTSDEGDMIPEPTDPSSTNVPCPPSNNEHMVPEPTDPPSTNVPCPPADKETPTEVSRDTTGEMDEDGEMFDRKDEPEDDFAPPPLYQSPPNTDFETHTNMEDAPSEP